MKNALIFLTLSLALNACSGDTKIVEETVIEVSTDKIMIVGDSFEYWSRGNWPTMVDAKIKQNIINFSQGGRTLIQMEERFVSDYLTIEPAPKTVMIAGGINDIGRGNSLESMQLATTMMIDALPIDTCVVLFDIPPFSSASYWTQEKQDKADNYTDWTNSMTETDRCISVFSYRAVLDRNNDSIIDVEYDNGDGLHPNTEFGQPAIASGVYDFLENIN